MQIYEGKVLGIKVKEFENKDHLLFLIDDPSVEVTPKLYINMEPTIMFRFKTAFPVKTKVAIVVKKLDHEFKYDDYYNYFMENNELDMEMFQKPKFSTTLFTEDKKIIYNGTYYKLFDSEKFLSEE